MPDSLAILAAVPEIQSELSVTDEQKELLEAMLSDLLDPRRRRFRGRGGFRGRDGRSQRMREQMTGPEDPSEKLVISILEPGQSDRLRQLRLQWEGIRALDRAAIVTALELSDAQVEKIREIRGDASSRDDRDPDRRAQLERELAAALTKDQVEKWESMKGKAFAFPDWLTDFDRRGFRRPGRDGGGPRP